MQSIFVIFGSLLVGGLLSIYLPMNSLVSKYLGSAITANITFFFMALVTSVLLFVVCGERDTLTRVGSVPPYLYLTGFVSAFIVLATTFLIPKMGVRRFFILTISGQILVAMLVSHFGWLQTPHDPIAVKKILGALLVLAGAVISTL